MRRRIYDAWNVLKAASIIIPWDRNEKYYMYNHAVLREESEAQQEAVDNAEERDKPVAAAATADGEEQLEEAASAAPHKEEDKVEVARGDDNVGIEETKDARKKDSEEKIEFKTDAQIEDETAAYERDCRYKVASLSEKFLKVKELVKS